MLFRILALTLMLGIAIFLQKETIFTILLAPSHWDFVTYQCLEQMSQALGLSYQANQFQIQFISTELASQFMIHLSTSAYLAILLVSPYLICEMLSFISPALYGKEKRYAIPFAMGMYSLFALGLLLSYFIIFPLSFQFLGTYQVLESINNTITLASYISNLIMLSFMMGILFQLPILILTTTSLGLISIETLRRYRRHTVFVLMLLAAIITPADVFSLILVSLPLYLLYELSLSLAAVLNIKKTQPNNNEKNPKHYIP